MDRPAQGRYILREQHIAHRKTKGLLSRKNSEPTSVLPGSLWADYYDNKIKKHEKIGFSHFISLEFENLILSCPPQDVAYLSPVEYELLAPVPVHGDRIRILENREWICEGISLRPGDHVHIVKHVNLPDHSSAVVRYKGHLEGKLGIYFGLELMDENRGKGFTNGTIFNTRYFHCDPNCGIFCTLARVRRNAGRDEASGGSSTPSPAPIQPLSRSHPGSPVRNRANVSNAAGMIAQHRRDCGVGSGGGAGGGSADSVDSATELKVRRDMPEAVDDADYPLSLNERIVWLGDAGPEFGTVRWVGRLPDSLSKDDITVGVEFDRPVGSGTGKYKEVQLFKTRPNHAALIPMIGLMKEDEYINPTPVKMPIDFEDRPPRHIRQARMRAARSLAKVAPPSAADDNSPDEGQYSSVIKRLTPRPQDHLDLDQDTWIRRQPPHHGAGAGPGVGNNQSHNLQLLTTFKPLDPDAVLDDVLSTVGHNAGKFSIRPGPVCDTSLYNISASTNLSRMDPLLNNGEPGRDVAEYKSIGTRLADTGRQNEAIYATVTNGVKPKVPVAPASYSTAVLSAKKKITFSNEHQIDRLTPSPPPPLRVKSAGSVLAPQSVLKPHRPLNPLPEHMNHVDDEDENVGQVDVLRGPSRPNNGIPPPATTPTTPNHTCLSDVSDSTASSPVDPALNSSTHTTQVQIELPPRSERSCKVADIELGSMVEILQTPVKYGVVRWRGVLPESKDPTRTILGLEMEEENADYTDGTFNGRRIFHCPANKGFFAYLNKVTKDTRFLEQRRGPLSGQFGSTDSPDIPGILVPPISYADLASIVGRHKGIQGHHNSCYLDATLFSMFAFSQVFDAVLHRAKCDSDVDEYEHVQRVLKESVVNPLRKQKYVRADKVLQLRTLLDRLSTVRGLVNEEKDPEEFLNSLLNDTLKCDHFIKLSSGQESFMYQLIIEKNEQWILPTTQQLLGLSFLQSNIKLAEIPPCLIIQMPRFGKDYKMYPRIIPSPTLDITDLLLTGPRECIICGTLATYECKSCYRQFGDSLDKIAFCNDCQKSSHLHPSRCTHTPAQLNVPPEYQSYLQEQTQLLGVDNVRIHRERMELFAVLSIETSHYVAFVKCGSGDESQWMFFDSMADRKGEEHGYNIPEVVACPELSTWLKDSYHERILNTRDDRALPEHARRVLCDAYMCFYQNPDAVMYK